MNATRILYALMVILRFKFEELLGKEEKEIRILLLFKS